MNIHHFFDPATWTLTYVVWDPETRDAVVIDPVLDFDMFAVATSTASNDAVVAYAKEHDLKVHWVLETHAHADHLSGSQDLKERLGCRVGIGEHIVTVQQTFKGIFDLPDSIPTDGSQFDALLTDGETLHAGRIAIEVLHTPGHTPACVTYKIGDALFTGDALFMPDFGTGRCDFPAGSAERLYDAIMGKIYSLPDETRIFVGHDYMPGGRELAFQTTVGASKTANVQLRADMGKTEFVTFRTERDATLRPPKLIFQSVQVNVDAGKLPQPSGDHPAYLKLPMNVFG